MDNQKNTSRLGAFIKGSIILVISNICLKAVNFFLMPLYTKNLTTEMLGVSDSITTFTGLLFPLLVMGLDSAYSAFYFDDKIENQSKKVFNTFNVTMIVLSIIPLISIAFAHQLSVFLFGSADYQIPVILALCSVSFNMWFLPFSLEVRMQNRMLLFGLVNFTGSLFMIFFNILFVSYLKLGTISLIASTVIVNAIQFVLYLLFTKVKFSKNMVDFKLLKSMIVFGLPLIPSVVMMWVLSLSDRYVILHYLGQSDVGLYGIGARFVTILNVVISAVSTSYATFAFGNKANKNAKEQYTKVLNVVSLILVAACFTISLFSKELVYMLTDKAYHSSYIILRDLVFAQMMYGVTSIVSYGIFFEKKPKYALIATVCGAVVNLVLNIIFVPRYGIAAAAITTLIGYSITFVISYVTAQKLYYCPYGIVRIIITFVILYFVSWLGMETNLMVKILIWIGCAALTLLAFRDVVMDIFNMIKDRIKSKKENKYEF